MSETVFTKVDYTLSSLMDAIELGSISLPDIQRPFVWTNAKVRNLFDSMYQGFPVGYLLFWENASADDARAIGTNNKQKIPNLLIVDGQQRLTGLYAVVRGVPVVREDYEAERIEIAFDAVTEKFAVADAATARDKRFIPNISAIWSKDTDLFELADNYLVALEADQPLDHDTKKKIRKALSRLQNLLSFPFTSLALSPSISEEQVAEIFVRINSAGKQLNQSDFILTLMSVFWDEGRAQLENFCRRARKPSGNGPSPYNHFIQPTPDQLLRADVALGFKRGRLQSVYALLRGKDMRTQEFDIQKRGEQFATLKKAQERVLNLQHWQDFFKCIVSAGFRSGKIISSENGLIFAYALYLIGRTEFNVDEFRLRRLIAKWFFMTALTGRFSSSPESKMEFDLARFRDVTDADSFVQVLDDICDGTLTTDFWSITLPMDLATSAARSPSLYAYFAALNLLDAWTLFSKNKVSELLDPVTDAMRTSLERHHLFPKAHLHSIGITSQREINQIANYALVEWGDNSGISDRSPSEYLPKLASRFSANELERMYYWHALPDDWQDLPYTDFLMRRRELMARVIRDAYNKLSGEPTLEQKRTTGDLLGYVISQGETTTTEFKSVLRLNIHTGERDPRLEHSVLRTIAGFLNAGGGTLIVGVKDDGEPLGIQADNFPNEDKMYLHLVNLVRERMGPSSMMYIHPHFEDYEGVRVMVVDCSPAKAPVHLKDSGVDKFYIRTGASTSELTPKHALEYVGQRFKL